MHAHSVEAMISPTGHLPTAQGNGPRRDRRTLLTSSLGRVEVLQCRGLGRDRSPEDFSPEFQVCLPYAGLFVWHVGDDEVVADPNQVLFVSAGEAFRLSEPLPAGFAELIITPATELLAEISGHSSARLSSHPLFVRRSHRASPAVQFLCARALHMPAAVSEPLRREELLIGLLRLTLGGTAVRPPSSIRTGRLLASTKEFLEANLAAPLRLSDVARAVSASPAYLTDLFRRHEGVPLHRYLVQLRLARSLVELPHADDLTSLALDLGFSSHSHFTSSFYRAFRCTPSAFRTSTRLDARSTRRRVMARSEARTQTRRHDVCGVAVLQRGSASHHRDI